MNLEKKVFLGVNKSILNVDMFLFVWNTFLCTTFPFLEKGSSGRRKGPETECRRGKEQGQACKVSSTNYSWGASESREAKWAVPRAMQVIPTIGATLHAWTCHGKDEENKGSPETFTARLHSEMTRDLGRCAKSLDIIVPVGIITELPSQLSLGVRSSVKNMLRIERSDHSMQTFSTAQGYQGSSLIFIKHQQGLK